MPFPAAKHLAIAWPGLLLALLLSAPGYCDTDGQSNPVAAETLTTLANIISLRISLQDDIKDIKARIAQAQSDPERAGLLRDLEKAEADLQTVSRNFESVATGVDASKLRAETVEAFDFQKEIFALLRPAIDEMKEMTAHVRQKADQKEKIAYYEERLPIIRQAIGNLENLARQGDDPRLNDAVAAVLANWKKQLAFMSSELQAAELQLSKLVASETSITEASQSYLKSFFQKRGLYITEALLVVFVVVLLSRLSLSMLRRYFPGFKARHRSFRVRLVELIHRILTFVLIVIGPMIVFYVVEDWVLFSLGLLLLIGAALTVRQTLPRYWHQMQIFLNIGAVREGERLYLDGIPWLVEEINFFCTLNNPVAELSQRLHIEDMVKLKSRPCKSDEPWFPCRKGDWVILNDGVRGKVVGISPELVQLVERGGAKLTYLTGDFLAKSPRNLAVSFRLKEIIGISYTLQREATTTVIASLQDYVMSRLQEEGYGEQLVSLRVEFNRAAESSLEMAVIADFKGEVGDLYNRLRRALQRYCTDACTEYGWEIPFPQLTLHGAPGRS
ncbi:MAG TPA: hypothetical protein PKZ35_03680 [Gammaproteobacteria bacterium]|nr:hypothetical protein [Chromatiaceae bacterium]HPE79081.1 hypothetical protein [Gammaproteobacteria bacterium]